MDIINNTFININLPAVESEDLILSYERILGYHFRTEENADRSGSNKLLSIKIANTTIMLSRVSQSLEGAFVDCPDNITAIFVLSGDVRLEVQDGLLTCRRGDGVALNTSLARRVTFLAGTEFCMFKVRIDDIVPLLERLAGRRLDEQLQIATSFDIRQGTGYVLAAILAATVAGSSGGRTPEISPCAADFLQSSWVALVLENLPHNYSRGMSHGGTQNAPLQIRRAVDHILAHAHEDITVQDVAHAAGVGLRTLQQSFRKVLRTSPQEYIKAAKLHGARRELEDPHSQRSVEEIARRWGFANRGHFAAQYRRLFGELPSETRRAR
ncbi:AraC family transcriptional regulator [Bosea sp. RAF48]|uniref:AraC family transcriptional regulator n=1 Tax=Bosea sp. RAF48 TaxID=3237480 RepID=UPI003F92AD5A